MTRKKAKRSWLSWRILGRMAFVLAAAAAVVFFVLTLFWWLASEPGPEPLFSIAGAVVSVVFGIGSLLLSRKAPETSLVTPRPYEPSSADIARTRADLLGKMRRMWIKGFLEQSLHHVVRIELDLEERPDAVGDPWEMVVQTKGERRSLPRGVGITEVYDEMEGDLLILGAPGAGKTTMLLELARDLVARAEADDTARMPAVFLLSSWSDPDQSLGEWLVDEFYKRYGFSGPVARRWIEENELILLLDGLDEVAEERRDACAQAIDEVRRAHTMPAVVCSRTEEYEGLTTQLGLQGAVCIQPLDREQVEVYFRRAGSRLSAVRKMWQTDEVLQEMVQSPLMLSVMSLAYAGKTVEELQSLGTVEARRNHLFDTYVEKMFARRGKGRRYTAEQTLHWLSWLASRMSADDQTVFSLEELELGWLPTPARRQALFLARLGVALAGGLYGGLVFGLLFGLFVGVFAGLAKGLLFGLNTSLFSGWALCLFSVWLYGRLGEAFATLEFSSGPAGTLHWSWRRARDQLVAERKSVPAMVVAALLLGLAAGVLFGLASGLVTVLIVGSVLGLGVTLYCGLDFAETETRDTPHQGIRQGVKNTLVLLLVWGLFGGLIVGLIGGGVLGLYGKLVLDLDRWLVFGLLLSVPLVLIGAPLTGLLLGGAHTGLFVSLHYSIRFILFCHDSLPWRVVPFLDHAVERVFLRRVGGSYTFVHRLVQEHFAALDDPLMVPKLTRKRLPRALIGGTVVLAIAYAIYAAIFVIRPPVAALYHRATAQTVMSSDPEQAYDHYIIAAEIYPDNSTLLNDVCWAGSLAGHADEVVEVCEKAVELAPDNGLYRDSRGLCRALTGDYGGAIEDFEFYVEWAKENGEDEQDRAKREVWIAALEAGENPFTEEVLKELAGE
jgi:DNA polymerase III delta prime subunit